MDRNNFTTDEVINVCARVLYEEYNEEVENDFFACMEKINITYCDEYTINWCLNTLNFLAATNIQDRPKFIKIESCKLRLLSAFVEYNEYIKYILTDDVNTSDTNKVYMENEFGEVYKRYIPNRLTRFKLPPDGVVQSLKIVGKSQKNDKAEFKAVVEIDHLGYVQRVISEPRLLVDNSTIHSFSDVYTDLLSDVLKYNDDDDDEDVSEDTNAK